MISFLIFVLAMVLTVSAMALKARKSNRTDEKTEAAAMRALPEIGRIAEKKYEARYGEAPADSLSGHWYPGSKRHKAR